MAAGDMDLNNMRTRELRMFVERHTGALYNRIEDCTADANEINGESSIIESWETCEVWKGWATKL